jgi:hypothetical protein
MRVLSRRALGLMACGFLLATPSLAAAKPSAKVSFLKGEAQVLRAASKYGDLTAAKNAPWKRVKVGTKLNQGDAVRTQTRTRLEMKVPDGSRVRLGSKSSLVLSQGHFSKSGERKVTFTLWLGKVWAKVAKRAGAGSSFEVKTQNAVAGVRGTSFAVMASLDSSSVVKVYTGSVGVKKNGAGANGKTPRRREVAGPQRIDKKQWEEVIATAMTQVKVTNLGQIQPAEDFVDDGEDLQWAMWNKERDAAIQ